MPGAVQVAIVAAVVVIGVVLRYALGLLEESPRRRRPGYMDRSPNGSDKPRWRVRPR